MYPIVVQSDTLTDGYDRRYVIVDAGTGDVMDDAQGSGYRSRTKAMKSFVFKNSPEGRAQIAALKQLRKENRAARMEKQKLEKQKKKAYAKKTITYDGG